MGISLFCLQKRWAQKEQEVREELKSRLGPASADFGAFQGMLSFNMLSVGVVREHFR